MGWQTAVFVGFYCGFFGALLGGALVWLSVQSKLHAMSEKDSPDSKGGD